MGLFDRNPLDRFKQGPVSPEDAERIKQATDEIPAVTGVHSSQVHQLGRKAQEGVLFMRPGDMREVRVAAILETQEHLIVTPEQLAQKPEQQPPATS